MKSKVYKNTEGIKNLGSDDLLLILRGIASLAVVLWHAGGYLEPYPAWMNIPGRTAVWLFFGISGYVIAYGYVYRRYELNAHGLTGFYYNRLLRIYPLFITLTLVGWLTETVLTGSSPLNFADIPSQVFALQFDQNYLINSVFWTLGIELHFYILSPLFAIPLLSYRPFWYLIVPLCCYVISVIWIYYAHKEFGWSFDGRNLVACLPHFLAGMIACRLSVDIQVNSQRFRNALLVATVLIILTNLLYHLAPQLYWSVIGIVLVDAAIICLIIAHASWERKNRGGSIALLTWLGTLSYGLYAWHGYWLRVAPDLKSNFIALAGLSLFCAYLTYLYVEIPALANKKSAARGVG